MGDSALHDTHRKGSNGAISEGEGGRGSRFAFKKGKKKILFYSLVHYQKNMCRLRYVSQKLIRLFANQTLGSSLTLPPKNSFFAFHSTRSSFFSFR